MISIGLFISYKQAEKKQNLNNDQIIVQYILQNSFYQNNVIDRITHLNKEWTKELLLLNQDYQEITEKKQIKEPIIYLYNSHPTEEYASSTIGEFSINPTVIMNNYILEDVFNKNGYLTYVEEQSVRDILNENHWNYASSYKASRILMNQRKTEYPSLKYYIDIHRDSIPKEKTTIEIGGRSYAKILFIIGLENESYQENMLFTEKIVEKLNQKYPSLCKGIYKKEGVGVNGIYNQDFSSKTILIEIGGYENTTIEVLNSSLAFAECYMEVIYEENN